MGIIGRPDASSCPIGQPVGPLAERKQSVQPEGADFWWSVQISNKTPKPHAWMGRDCFHGEQRKRILISHWQGGEHVISPAWFSNFIYIFFSCLQHRVFLGGLPSSTNQAWSCLASEISQDQACSGWHRRRREITLKITFLPDKLCSPHHSSVILIILCIIWGRVNAELPKRKMTHCRKEKT